MQSKVSYVDIINLFWKPREGKEFYKLVKDLGENPRSIEAKPGGIGDEFFQSGLLLVTLRYLVDMAFLKPQDGAWYKAFPQLPAGIQPTDSLETVRSRFRTPPIDEGKENANPLHLRFRLSDSYLETESQFDHIYISVFSEK